MPCLLHQRTGARPAARASVWVATWALSVALDLGAAEVYPVVPGEPALPVLTKQHGLGPSALPRPNASAVVNLPRPASARLAGIGARYSEGQHKGLLIGIHRDLAEAGLVTPAPRLGWTRDRLGRFETTVSVRSEGAAALRLGLNLAALPAATELRFWSTGGSDSHATTVAQFQAAAPSAAVAWGPVLEGNEQTLWIRLPSATVLDSVGDLVAGLAHLATSPGQRFKLDYQGRADSCNEDVACVPAPSQAYLDAVRSTVKLVYSKNGGTYVCTGTLINDGDATSQTPYVLTAAHCMTHEDVAASLNTFWFFEAQGCRSQAAASPIQLTGGAKLVLRNPSTDVAVVRLLDPAPAGAYFAGWDATPVTSGDAVVDIHHPRGDLKKVSIGVTVPATAAYPGFSQVAWLTGTTEPGSSGSSLRTLRGQEYLVRGTLSGGSAVCANSGVVANPGNRDTFGQLDHDFPTLKKWLLSGPRPLHDYSDLWWSPDQSGWAVNVVQSPQSSLLFVTWMTYDAQGQPLWFAAPSGSWTSTSSFTAPLYRARGQGYAKSQPTLSPTLEPVGQVTLTFTGTDSAVLAATVDGVSASKALARLAF